MVKEPLLEVEVEEFDCNALLEKLFRVDTRRKLRPKPKARKAQPGSGEVQRKLEIVVVEGVDLPVRAPGAGAPAGMQMQPLYRLAPGVGPGAFALRVSALAGIPTGLLRAAAAQAERLHEQQRRRQHAAQQLRLAAAVVRACEPACTNTGPEARLPVLLRLQEDARVSLAGSP